MPSKSKSKSKKARMRSIDDSLIQHSLFSDTSKHLYTLWEESESALASDSDCAQLVLTYSSGSSTSIQKELDQVKTILFEKAEEDEKYERQKSRKDAYGQGILAASDFIVSHLLNYRYVTEKEINIVTSMIVTGEEVDFTSNIGKRFLKNMKPADHNFIKLAFLSAAKVRNLGGVEEDMEAAVICILACRGFRYIRNTSFDEKQLEEISERTAKSVMNDFSVANDTKASGMCHSRDEKQTSIYRSYVEPDSRGFDLNFLKKYINLNFFCM